MKAARLLSHRWQKLLHSGWQMIWAWS